MAKTTGEADLLTLAMRRAHADAADRRAPKYPSDDENATSDEDATEDTASSD